MHTIQSQDGTTIAYDVYGSGPALIYIMGATCHRRFDPIIQDAKAFSAEFTVYCYDRRGRGDSGNVLPYAPAREVEDIEALIDVAGGSAFLYGHSSGAVLTLEAALKLQQKIAKIAIYDAPYVHDETEKREFSHLGNKVKELLSANKHRQALTTFLKGIGMPSIFVWLLPLFPGWGIMQRLAPTLAYDIDLTGDFPPVERLAAIALPTQIMIGAKSPVSIQEVAKALAKSIPNAGFAELAGQDHMVKAKILLPRLVAFFKHR